MRSATPRPLSEFQRLIQACGDFLSLAAFTYCGIDRLEIFPHVNTLNSAEDPPPAPRPGTFHAVPIYKDDQRRLGMCALVRFRELEPKAPAIY